MSGHVQVGDRTYPNGWVEDGKTIRLIAGTCTCCAGYGIHEWSPSGFGSDPDTREATCTTCGGTGNTDRQREPLSCWGYRELRRR